MIKILTLNTWQENGPWQDRWEVIFDGLNKLQPDIVGFQEVFNVKWAEQVAERAGYPYFYVPNKQAGLLTLSKYPIAHKSFIQLKTQSPTEPYFRYLTLAIIQVLSSELAFMNTHLTWLPEEGDIRYRQVHEILDFANRNAADFERILVGDFNAVALSPEMKHLREAGKFTDCFACVQPVNPGITWNNRNNFTAGSSHKLPDRRIDYILAANRRNLLHELKSCELVMTQQSEKGIFGSDHFGVLATFE